MRTKCDEDRLQNSGDVIRNGLHALGRANGLTVHINWAAAGAAVQSNASREEFARNGKKRPWLEICQTFASTLRAASTNGKHGRVMSELCKLI
jgi:hypothetical protein